SARKDNPPIQSSCPFATSVAGRDSRRIRHSRDDVAESNFLARDEPGQTHAKRAWRFIRLAVRVAILHDDARAFRHDIRWYAARPSRRGGIRVARRGATGPVTASRSCPPGAAGNNDFKSAMAPVTKGAAALVPEKGCIVASGARLTTPSPGAASPRLPAEWL